MSSIRRHMNGNLFFDFRYRGERCREYTALKDTPANRKLLKEALNKIEAEITLGTFDYAKAFPNSKRAVKFRQQDVMGPQTFETGSTITPRFSDFVEEWITEREVEWKRSYRIKQRDILNKHLLPNFGERRVSDIRKADLLKYRAQLAKGTHDAEGGLSASRVNQIMNLIKQILDEAADRFDFTTPYVRIKPLRQTRSKVDPFSLEEVQRFLEVVDPNWRNYFVVRFFTGMRTSEIDGLKWRYVDFDRREILIEETRVWGEEDTPKTNGSLRAIQMSAVVYDALKAQELVSRDKSPYVFCTTFGYPVRYHNINNRVWYPALEKAGLKRRNPYQTRHTAATLWLASGESPEWIARQMGHSNTKMLFTVYSRYVPNLTRQDGSAFERLLLQNFSGQAAPLSNDTSGRKIYG